jgi:hypothetical protein
MTAEQLAVLCQLHHLTSLYSHRTLSSPHPNPTRYTLSVAWDLGLVFILLCLGVPQFRILFYSGSSFDLMSHLRDVSEWLA